MHWDRQGNPLDLMEWARLMEDPEYRRIADTTIGDYWISTVWLGIDHGFGMGVPIIFETMIFDARPEVRARRELPLRVFLALGGEEREDLLPLDGDQWRYATEEQARRGHVEACELVRLELGIASGDSEEQHTNGKEEQGD